jgi:hypothetical protein
MNLEKLQQTLMAAARAQFRAQVPDESVPLAFEKRISALLAARVVVDQWAQWSRGLWRSAVPCAALAVLCGAWFLLHLETSAPGDLSQDFENTLLASADQSDLAQ